MKELEKILERKEINAIKDIEEENERCNTVCEGCCSDIEDGECNCRDALIIRIIEKMAERMNDDWIPVEERLPEERIDPITNDFYDYQVTVKFGEDMYIRHCKFGRGHWYYGATNVVKYVIAWLPRPEPYQPEKITKQPFSEGSDIDGR